ncbi:hypothetical protein [uncultured Paraglaciecola sp.]|uniref:hypothetical protein n=1 Tax=uncultured Paraglaciecola sp. TaxID=1765024 RepID=UPI00261C0B9E|nr:hypothetical protein [uncultured Paraglaciecola sp.]
MKPLLILFCFCFCFCFCLSHVQARTLQDPTKPHPSKPSLHSNQNAAAMTPMALRLTAIINNNQSMQAIINGTSLIQGQQIQGYKVILIGKNHVILDGLEGRKTLFVNNNNIKKDTHNGF